jgi:hypothetical protein
MHLTKRRIRAIVTNECLLKKLKHEHIEAGCNHAEYLFDRQQSLPTSVLSGICLAEDLARRQQEREKAAILNDVLHRFTDSRKGSASSGQ